MTSIGCVGSYISLAIIILNLIAKSTAAGNHSSSGNKTKVVDYCDGTKGCWLVPGDCYDQSSCQAIVTWSRLPSHDLVIEFDSRIDDIKAPMGKYVALGFSDDYKMGNDFVIECVANPSGRVHAYVSFNDGTTNVRNKKTSQLLLYNTSGSVEDGRLHCRTTVAVNNFTSSEIPAMESWAVIDISKAPSDYYLLLAKGSADPETDTLLIHWLMDGDLFPWIATEKVDMVNGEVKTLRSAKHYDIPRWIQYDLVKVHGVLMITAWWVLAATAMFISRNFKPVWLDRKLCGKPVWFQLHRSLMIISLILQCSAFALIFIQRGDLITCSKKCDVGPYNLMLHAYMGIACTAGALIQPFMALLRPNPDSPKRPIFNWLHWFIGTGSFITATITIFLSSTLGKAGLRRLFKYDPDYVMAGYMAAFLVSSMAFEIIWYIRFRPAVSGRIELTSLSGPKKPMPSAVNELTDKPSHSGLQTAVLFFFIIAATSLCATLAYYIVSNAH